MHSTDSDEGDKEPRDHVTGSKKNAPRYEWNDISNLPALTIQVKAWHHMHRVGAVRIVYEMAIAAGATQKEAVRIISKLLGISPRWAGERIRQAQHIQTLFESQGMEPCPGALHALRALCELSRRT